MEFLRVSAPGVSPDLLSIGILGADLTRRLSYGTPSQHSDELIGLGSMLIMP